MQDLISRQAVFDEIWKLRRSQQMLDDTQTADLVMHGLYLAEKVVEELPSAQPTLYGYNINQLALIARILQKENLPPERVTEALSDMGSIIAMAYDEFMESLRKVFEQDGFEQ